MRYLITGAGQIGSQLALDLTRLGHEVTVLRRSAGPSAVGATVLGDAGDRQTVRAAAAGAAAIFHCIHAPYSERAWRAALPQREVTVMDVAAELNIPVVFPESVYAFGRGAQSLSEHTPIAPVSPLGRVRAELLAARQAHAARTASVVASDLFGPTATRQGSVLLATVVAPAFQGQRCWTLSDPDMPHALTYIPDLTRAMAAAADLAASGGVTLLAPTDTEPSARQLATTIATAAGMGTVRLSRVPGAALAASAAFSPAARELYRQRYLWNAPSVLQPGRLTTQLGLTPTPWPETLREWAATAGSPRPVRAARP